jgi:hypothetical protein
MTKKQALKKGFVYEGMVGYVPVYLTELHKFGKDQPGVCAKNWLWGIVLDIQEFATQLANMIKDQDYVGDNIFFGDRLDGQPYGDKEFD